MGGEETAQSTQANTSFADTGPNGDFNFDMGTILKIKSVMDTMNSSKNDPRSNLLLSLKPYLNSGRRETLDQCMQFLKISQVIEAFQADRGASHP